jgi:alpha-mannosidase
MDSVHHGVEPWEQSFLEIMPGNVWVLAIKRAERVPDGIILRLQERSGKPTQATLKSVPLGLEHTIDLAPWELKTLLVTPMKTGRSQVKEVTLLEG